MLSISSMIDWTLSVGVPLIGYHRPAADRVGELLVTVTVAPKSGGLSDGVCQAIVYVTPQDAPVSAGGGYWSRRPP
jgi:hypothetical protein